MADHYRLEGRIHRQKDYGRVHFDKEKQRIVKEEVLTSYEPVLNFDKEQEFEQPAGDYIELNYFGEKYSLSAFHERYKLDPEWDDIQPIYLDQRLPERVNGQQ